MKCPLCGETDSAPHHADGGWNYRRCSRCRFVFLSPKPDEEEVRRIYLEEAGATFHRSADLARDDEGRMEALGRFRVLRPVIESCAPKRAVEIGCGAGYFLRHLQRCGFSCVGTELGGGHVPGVEVVGGGIEAVPPGEYGLVALFNVLSHLFDPVEDLKKVRGMLSRDGVVVLETGNAAEVEPSRVPHWGAPEHMWHFGERNLMNLLELAGLERVALVRRNVEWQWLLLRARVPRPVGGGGGGNGGAAAPRRRPAWKRLASRLLLAARFGAGRIGADRRHFCTVFLAARRKR